MKALIVYVSVEHGNTEKVAKAMAEAIGAETRKAEDKGGYPAAGGQLVTLEPFVVNLADPMGRRYLKANMDVEVTDGDVAAELNAAMPKIKDALLLLLSSKSFADISSMDKKIELKNEIVDRLNLIIGKAKAWTYVAWVAVFSLLSGLLYGAWHDGTSLWLLLGLVVLAFLIALGVAAFIGLTNGWFVTFLKIPSFLVTLGMLLVVRPGEGLEDRIVRDPITGAPQPCDVSDCRW